MLGHESAKSAMALSEENLKMHNAAYPKVSALCGQTYWRLLITHWKNDGYFQVNLIREERAMATEMALYRQVFGDQEEVEDAKPSDAMRNIGDSYANTLALYTAPFASSEAPMSRFLSMGPTQDAHPWMAKATMEESGVSHGDLEALDLRRLASEMVDVKSAAKDEAQGSGGTPRPSSDTLSVSRFRELTQIRRAGKTVGTRMKKKIGVRKTPSSQTKASSATLGSR
ncbi:hypothetical protein K491DRAFT_685416 [Lophiostoma macrostomum CBS 122681]|uniref:Uncharacterized protein n=1 Tax=Lophiostoma macrostomum CBS 122681 TaxID=1314788 RepID=A0A6A6SN19_9PLEO|nr:hypothetical protein K491DRAFT_685416 [Lophiostoma macrostomum CBS 122681]